MRTHDKNQDALRAANLRRFNREKIPPDAIATALAMLAIWILVAVVMAP